MPVLDAAHIRPYAKGGHHELTNGLLLRKDIHRLFDLGYVTVSSDNHFEVSRRIKEKFENGRHYYAMQGTKLAEPKNVAFSPSSEVLEWHQREVFLK